MAYKLQVGNLSDTTSDNDLRTLFAQVTLALPATPYPPQSGGGAQAGASVAPAPSGPPMLRWSIGHGQAERRLAAHPRSSGTWGMGSGAGAISAASVIKDEITHASTGFAFVRMTTRVDTQKAISLFNTYRLGERPLTVSLATPRPVRSSGRPRRFQP